MEKIIVEQSEAGRRIDKFLVEEFFLYSRGEIIRKIKKGEVRLNGKNIKPSYLLEESDEIELENFSRELQTNEVLPNFDIPLNALFENEDFLIVNKQAGIQVHPSFHEKEYTLVNALVAHYPELKDVHDQSEGANLRPGIVHRLDKDTSGVMVIARNTQAFDALKEAFKSRHIEKQYLTIVEGILANKEGEIKKDIARSSDYRKQVIARKNTKTIIRPALTIYKVLQEFDAYSMLEVFPKTGRMHQIRIHLASLGHPVVGDLVYGNLKADKSVGNIANRQLLHAHKLKFELFGKQFEFKAPMPSDFVEFMSKIGGCDDKKQ